MSSIASTREFCVASCLLERKVAAIHQKLIVMHNSGLFKGPIV